MANDLLYHGTHLPQHILGDGVLRRAPLGYECVSLSRSYDAAYYFASLGRGPEEDERLCGIFVFSRAKLVELGFELVPFHDPIFGEHARDEEEEQVWADIPLDCDALVRLDLLDPKMIVGTRDELLRPLPHLP
jgi:hypothetical protein